jgi:hypothetical protein
VIISYVKKGLEKIEDGEVAVSYQARRTADQPCGATLSFEEVSRSRASEFSGWRGSTLLECH